MIFILAFLLAPRAQVNPNQGRENPRTKGAPAVTLKGVLEVRWEGSNTGKLQIGPEEEASRGAGPGGSPCNRTYESGSLATVVVSLTETLAPLDCDVVPRIFVL